MKSWTSISLPLQKKKRGYFPHFSYPSLIILWKNAKTDGTKSFLAIQILAVWTHQIQVSFKLSNHLSEIFSSSKVAHRLGLLYDLKYVKYFYCAASKKFNQFPKRVIGLVPTPPSVNQAHQETSAKRNCKCKELIVWTTQRKCKRKRKRQPK